MPIDRRRNDLPQLVRRQADDQLLDSAPLWEPSSGRQLVERERRHAHAPVREPPDRPLESDRRGSVIDVDDRAMEAGEIARAEALVDPDEIALAERHQPRGRTNGV